MSSRSCLSGTAKALSRDSKVCRPLVVVLLPICIQLQDVEINYKTIEYQKRLLQISRDLGMSEKHRSSCPYQLQFEAGGGVGRSSKHRN